MSLRIILVFTAFIEDMLKLNLVCFFLFCYENELNDRTIIRTFRTPLIHEQNLHTSWQPSGKQGFSPVTQMLSLIAKLHNLVSDSALLSPWLPNHQIVTRGVIQEWKKNNSSQVLKDLSTLICQSTILKDTTPKGLKCPDSSSSV